MHKRVLGAVALLGLTGALVLTGAAPARAHTMPALPVSVTLTSANLRRALSPTPTLRFGPLHPCVRATALAHLLLFGWLPNMQHGR